MENACHHQSVHINYRNINIFSALAITAFGSIGCGCFRVKNRCKQAGQNQPGDRLRLLQVLVVLPFLVKLNRLTVGSNLHLLQFLPACNRPALGRTLAGFVDLLNPVNP